MPARASSRLVLPAEKLVGALSFTHFEQHIAIDEPLKRAFYEIECVRGNWSMRALKRQIATLYFERFAPRPTVKTKEPPFHSITIVASTTHQ